MSLLINGYRVSEEDDLVREGGVRSVQLQLTFPPDGGAFKHLPLTAKPYSDIDTTS